MLAQISLIGVVVAPVVFYIASASIVIFAEQFKSTDSSKR